MESKGYCRIHVGAISQAIVMDLLMFQDYI